MNKSKHKTNNGAALVLTLGILALIAVMAVAFATTMRFEEKSGRNALYLVQARELASTGLNHAIAALKADLTTDEGANDFHDSLDETWITTFSGADVDLDNDSANESQWIYVHENADGTGKVIGRYTVLIQDEAGKVNINTAQGSTQLHNTAREGWTTYELDMTSITGIDTTKANNIISYRYGTNAQPGSNGTDDNSNATIIQSSTYNNDAIDNDGDGTVDEVGEGTDEPQELDPEFPYSDDRPFSSIEELTKVSGIGGNSIPSFKNYMTTSNYDINKYWEGNTWNLKKDLNHLISTGNLYNLNPLATNERFRLAANIIDYADRDNYPTMTTTNGASPSSANSYIGLEGLQFTEVMSNHTDGVYRENDENLGFDNSVTRSGTWSFGAGTDVGEPGETADYSWHWDNGRFDITIGCWMSGNSGGMTYRFETGELGDTSGSITGTTKIPNVLIRGNTINLHLEAAPENAAVLPNPAQTVFDNIYIEKCGKYIELVNISLKNINFDNTGADSWRLNIGGTLNPPIADGLPLTVTGGVDFKLSQAWNKLSDITSDRATPPTYAYLVITDSFYALDALFGNNDSGHWGDNPGKEAGIVLAINESGSGDYLYDTLPNAGANLAITNSSNQVIAYAPVASSYNITGYGGSPAANQSAQRVSAVDQVHAWFGRVNTPSIMNDTDGGAQNSEGGQNRYWQTKDRNYATVGEMGDVFLGTEKNETYNLASNAGTFLGKLDVSYKRLDVSATSTVVPSGWTGPTCCGYDGTNYYSGPTTGGPWNWIWAFDISSTAGANVNRSYRLRNGQVFDATLYGFFSPTYAYNFQNPAGTVRRPKPSGGAYIGSTSVNSNQVSIPITRDGSNSAKVNYLILSPEPYIWGRININTASSQVLGTLPYGSSYSATLISNRPYSNVSSAITHLGGTDEDRETRFKKISNLITVRSDVYRVIVQAEKIIDVDGDGVEGDASDQIVSTTGLDAVVDRNPSMRFPNTTNRYRIESIKYRYGT